MHGWCIGAGSDCQETSMIQHAWPTQFWSFTLLINEALILIACVYKCLNFPFMIAHHWNRNIVIYNMSRCFEPLSSVAFGRLLSQSKHGDGPKVFRCSQRSHCKTQLGIFWFASSSPSSACKEATIQLWKCSRCMSWWGMGMISCHVKYLDKPADHINLI